MTEKTIDDALINIMALDLAVRGLFEAITEASPEIAEAARATIARSSQQLLAAHPEMHAVCEQALAYRFHLGATEPGGQH